MGEATFSGGKAAATAGFHKALSSISEYIAPAAGALAGFFVGPGALGGTNSIYNALIKAFPSGASWVGRVAPLVMALISAGIGGLFWGLRRSGGLWMELLGGIVGGFFLGGAAGYAVSALNPSAAKNGLIDSFTTGIGGLAQGA